MSALVGKVGAFKRGEAGFDAMWRMMQLRVLLVLPVVLRMLFPAPALAQGEAPPPYVVRPGDTLVAIAAHLGTDVRALQQLNGVQDPRQIYPGQQLRWTAAAGFDMRTWVEHRVRLGEDLGILARRAGLTWADAARANRILNPGILCVGQALELPEVAEATATLASPGDTRLAAALRRGICFWDVLRLNPQPLYAGATLLLPGKGPTSFLPYPIVALDLMPQPVDRGQTAVITLETLVPASCDVHYVDRTESCYAQDATHLYALMGLSPMLDAGRYDVQLRVRAADAETSLTLPLIVSAGRYDYERIDLPPDRQALLDPALTQDERSKIAALQTVRSTERLWEFPFTLPVQAAVTSYYGSRRSYGGAFNSFHEGTDFRAEVGTPVTAPATGIVVLAEPLVVRGNAILIDHGWGVVTGYWHLSRIDVTVGQRVTQGQPIGAIGNTGLSTGPHLHWEMWVNGTAVSALQWLRDFAPFDR